MRHVLPAALVALAAALAAHPAAAQVADGDGRRVVVTGAAEVEAVPDLATVTAGVETRAETAAQALADNTAAMTAVFAALETAGIARRDMQTSNLSLGAVWEQPRDGGEARVTGYQASNMVTVRVRDIATLGAVIDAVTSAGSNRLYGVGFEVSDPKPALDDARERAVADARARAELYARAAGVALGPVQVIRETVDAPQPFFARAEAAMDAAPPVAEGTVSLRAQVTIVYALE